MSALSTSRLPSPSTSTPTPALATPTAAPQLAGNAAAQESYGTAAPAPDTGGGTFDEVLATMGALGVVVLEAMPLPIAIRAALRVGQAWTDDWLGRQPAREVYRAAPAEARKALDVLAPVGLGFELGVYGEGKLVAGFEGTWRASVERVASGFMVHAEGTLDGSAGLSIGMDASGAGDETIIGETAGAKVKAGNGGVAEWEIPVFDLLEHLATFEVTAIHDLLAGRPLDPAALIRALECLVRATPPSMIRMSAGVSAGGSGKLALPLLLGRFVAEAKRCGSAAVRFGAMGGEPFAEVHGESQDVLKHPLLTALGVPSVVGAQLTVRVVMGAQPRYVIIGGTTRGDISVEETYETTDLSSAAAWLLGFLEAPDGGTGEGEVVAPEALPDVTLTRSASRHVEDLTKLPDAVGAKMLRAGLEGIDAAMTADFVDLEIEADLDGTVRIPTDAVRAALEGRPLPVGEEEPEVAVLDAARAIAAHAMGGATYAAANTDLLDVEVGGEHVEIADLSMKSRLLGEAGFGGALTVAGVSGGASAGATWRTDLSALEPEERRAALAG